MTHSLKSKRHESSQEDYSRERQSLLMRDLELLLHLSPRALNSSLLALPTEARRRILEYTVPDIPRGFRPELHTCFWGADMVDEPWRHDVFGYAPTVPKKYRLHPHLLLVNRQLRHEFLQVYLRRCQLTLHAELRNTRENNRRFEYSPHVLDLPLLKYVTHVHFYIEWNYFITGHDQMLDQIRMTADLMETMDTLLAPLQAVEHIELSVLFFWKRPRKTYSLSMQDLFELEDIFKRHAENRWLQLLKGNKTSIASDESPAGVGYKLVPESKGRSGEMEIFVSSNLEEAMRNRRKSTVDFYGNYSISDPLPPPSLRIVK